MAKLNGQAGKASKLEESRPQRVFPTDRISFPRQLELLRAFGALSQSSDVSVPNGDVAKAVNMNAATVSLANPFFVDSGLILKNVDGNGSMPSPEVIAFAQAWQWSTEDAPTRLLPVIQKTWFSSYLIPKLRFSALKEDVAIQHLAEEAGASPSYRTRIEFLLLYMQAAGLITRDGGMVRLIESQSAEKSEVVARPASAEVSCEVPELKATVRPSGGMLASLGHRPAGGIQFQLNVKVDMQELSTWNPERITAFFSGLAQVLAAKEGTEKKSE